MRSPTHTWGASKPKPGALPRLSQISSSISSSLGSGNWTRPRTRRSIPLPPSPPSPKQRQLCPYPLGLTSARKPVGRGVLSAKRPPQILPQKLLPSFAHLAPQSQPPTHHVPGMLCANLMGTEMVWGPPERVWWQTRLPSHPGHLALPALARRCGTRGRRGRSRGPPHFPIMRPHAFIFHENRPRLMREPGRKDPPCALIYRPLSADEAANKRRTDVHAASPPSAPRL